MAAINESERDIDLIRHILRYCDDAIDAARQAETEEEFLRNRLYQHAAAMCVLEIGELSKHLSDSFVKAHPDIPWRAICRMRDMYAHHYHKTDSHQLWLTVTSDLPFLKEFCVSFTFNE